MAAVKGYDVSNLETYVQNNSNLLTLDSVFAPVYGDSIKNMSHQVGIKGSMNLNYLSTEAVLQEGGCGFNPSGVTSFSDRKLDCTLIKVQDEFCKYDLINKWMESQVRIASTENDPYPFEAQIFDGVVKSINEKLEHLVWQGSTNDGDLFNGIITNALGADSALTITDTVPSGSTVYEAVLAAYFALPEELLNASDTTVFLSPANYRAYVQELVAQKFYAPIYTPDNQETVDMFIPGTSIRVHKCQGMAGCNDVVATTWSNLVFGCDVVSDSESFDAWISKDNGGTLRYSVEFNAGVTTYFPDKLVIISEEVE